jgi:glycosyltransferase involved in cell wall biosynthesis
MKLSIIIPAYNEEHAIPKLFASLAKQSFRDFEIIVADAHSKDKTREVSAKAGAVVVDGGMPGPGRNRGAEKAKGDIVLFLDADVVLPDNEYLRDCIHEFDRRKLDIATCFIKPLSQKRADRFYAWFYNHYTRITRPVLPHAVGFCIFAKRTTHEAIHGFDEKVVFAEDMDYVQRAVKSGAKFHFLKSHKIPMDVRRFDRDGRVKTAVRFTLAEMYMVCFGGIKTDLFKYRFGHTPKKTK